MKKLPRKIKQWAEESYDALENALIIFKNEHPNPDEEKKLELITYATILAARNRGIKNREKISVAHNYVLDNLEVDFRTKDPGEPIYHSISFLLCYLDANVSFGILSESKAEDIMEYLSDNYEISIPT